MTNISIVIGERGRPDLYDVLVNSLMEQDLSNVDVHFVTDEATIPSVTALPNHHIHLALESAIAASQGEIIVFIGRNASLSVDALRTLSIVSDHSEHIAVWYSTRIVTSNGGGTQTSKSLPRFSPERLLGDNYLRSGFVVRKDAITSTTNSVTDNTKLSLYQLLLHLTWQYPSVGLVHKPLFVELYEEVPEIILQAEFQIVAEELSRRSITANVLRPSFGSRQIKRELFGQPLVSIIIPTGSQRRVINGKTVLLVEQCVNSILKKSTYEHFEIIIVQDQRSTINDSLMDLAKSENVRVIPFSQEFNFADKCNLGFVASSGQFVIFLNDDTEIISEDWIETLIGHLQDIGVGTSGPTLLLEDGRIQSASLCNNPAPHNYGAGLSVKDFYSIPHNQIAREVSGLTGACIAIRREVYVEVGGMCSEFPNNFNDIDLCFKLLYKNYRIIWTPFAQLTHFEAQSRDPSVSEDESQRLRLRWGRFFNNDKFTPV